MGANENSLPSYTYIHRTTKGRSICILWQNLHFDEFRPELLKPRVNNEKRVSNALYTPYNMLRQVTWLAAVRTWLAQGAKHLIFLRTKKNRGVFHEFYARFFINACFILWSARAFGRNRARVSLHSRPRPQRTIWIERSDWSIFEFLVRDFPKTSCTEYIARSILSSHYLLLLKRALHADPLRRIFQNPVTCFTSWENVTRRTTKC